MTPIEVSLNNDLMRLEAPSIDGVHIGDYIFLMSDGRMTTNPNVSISNNHIGIIESINETINGSSFIDVRINTSLTEMINSILAPSVMDEDGGDGL